VKLTGSKSSYLCMYRSWRIWVFKTM